MFFRKRKKWRVMRKASTCLARKALCCALILEVAYGVGRHVFLPRVYTYEESRGAQKAQGEPSYKKTYGISIRLKEGKIIFYRDEEKLDQSR